MGQLWYSLVYTGMETQKRSIYLAVPFLIAGLIYILFLLSVNLGSEFLIIKIGFIFIIIALVLLFWHVTSGYKKISASISEGSNRYGNLERLLLDIRDGKKTFFNEKRRFARYSDTISAKIAGSDTEILKILNISSGGVLLRTSRKFEENQIINLNIYLPLFPQPINVKAKVIRVAPCETKGKSSGFKMGIKYLTINEPDREKLTETLKYLSSSQ